MCCNVIAVYMWNVIPRLMCLNNELEMFGKVVELFGTGTY